MEKQPEQNNGGSTDYYKIPINIRDLQDLIEYKAMNFSQGNIFKAAYCLNDIKARNHSTKIRDLNKIIWFARREIKRLNSFSDFNIDKAAQHLLMASNCDNIIIGRKDGKDIYVSDIMTIFAKELNNE